jgi:hypothetical protein
MADTTDTITSSQRRLAALSRWDKVADRSAETRPMRDGRIRKLRDQVLEEFPGLTDEAEITSRVERKLKLHFERMRLNSLKTRRANAAAKRQGALDALAEAIATVEAESGADESARRSDETAA